MLNPATAIAYPFENRLSVLGVSINNVTMDNAVTRILDAVDAGEKTSFAFVNADCLNIASRDAAYARILSRQNMVFADGSGVRIAAQLRGQKVVDNVNGTDMFPLLCEAAAKAGHSLYLLGGRPRIADEVAKRMAASYPGLKIAGTADGYFTAADEPGIFDDIERTKADIVLVGFGAPKQEYWIHENREAIAAPVAIGVGGLFDYYSGRIARAPLAFRRIGMEWVWRMMQEPRRLWRRYIVGNPAFLARCTAEQVGPSLPLLPEGAQALAVRSVWRARIATRSFFKRVLDISISLVALLCLLPILITAALAIRLESPGPVFFRQTRIGLDGRKFRIWKYRSMFVDAEARRLKLLAESDREGSHFKMKSDPRITQVGSLIRRLSIDELPQLLNVIAGDMSIVGPRPNLEAEVANYHLDDLPRLSVKPGLTCFWQVAGRADVPWEKQVELDLDYVYAPSLLSDLKLMLRTIPAVLSGRGAY